MQLMWDRSEWKKLFVWALVGLSCGAAFSYFLWNAGPSDYFYDLPPCGESGAPYHHRLAANCQTSIPSPQGPLVFQTNEDGLRDMPRELILGIPHRVLLLGGGAVEGYWLREDQTLSSRLRERDPQHFYINGGLRGAGPLFQAYRLPALIETYQPEEVWLALDNRNLDDDLLACASKREDELAFGSDDQSLPKWQEALLGVARSGKLQARLRQHRRQQFVDRGRTLKCDECEGLRLLAETANAKKVPVRALVLDLGSRGEFTAGGKSPNAIEKLQSCLREVRVPFYTQNVDDLSAEEKDKYFWARQAYWNPLGAQHWADQVIQAGDPLSH